MCWRRTLFCKWKMNEQRVCIFLWNNEKWFTVWSTQTSGSLTEWTFLKMWLWMFSIDWYIFAIKKENYNCNKRTKNHQQPSVSHSYERVPVHSLFYIWLKVLFSLSHSWCILQIMLLNAIQTWWYSLPTSPSSVFPIIPKLSSCFCFATSLFKKDTWPTQ